MSGGRDQRTVRAEIPASGFPALYPAHRFKPGVRTDDLVAALTFDDGPDGHHTMRILEVLGHRRATATFFVVARRAAQFPEIVAAIRSGGHEIALHGDDHRPLIR